jgi:hypothetical protein
MGKPATCAECGAALIQPETGRPRAYCSAPCRRLAERKIKVAEQMLARARRSEQTARYRVAMGWAQEQATFWAAEVKRCEAELRALLAGAGDDDGQGDEAEAPAAGSTLARRRRG